MATRFHLNADTAPAVSPALQTYTHTDETTTPKRKLLVTDTSALSTRAYAPDSADHLVAGTALLGQFVSDPMDSGIVFTNGQAIVFAVQCLEAHAGNNQAMRIWAGIYSQDGSTLQRELRAVVSEGNELATSLTGRHLSTVQSGANYTTVAGDRLVVEFSVTGTPSAAGGVQGHNASLRIGGNGAGGDVSADDLDTGTTKNGWVEFTPTITFPAGDATASPSTVAAVTAVPGPAAQGAAIASPNAVGAVAAIPTPAVRGDAVATPATVAAIAAVPPPTASGGDVNGTASPATVAALAAVPPSTAQGWGQAAPNTVVAAASVLAPTVSGTARSTPATVAAVAGVPPPTAGSSNQANPVTVAAIAQVPPSIARGAAVASPFTVAAIAQIPAPSFPSVLKVYISEGDADALATMEGDASKVGSVEGGGLVRAGLEG